MFPEMPIDFWMQFSIQIMIAGIRDNELQWTQNSKIAGTICVYYKTDPCFVYKAVRSASGCKSHKMDLTKDCDNVS